MKEVSRVIHSRPAGALAAWYQRKRFLALSDLLVKTLHIPKEGLGTSQLDNPKVWARDVEQAECL